MDFIITYDNYKEIYDNIFHRDYDYIYFSLGSKYNYNNINVHNHLLPNFLLYNNYKNILAISIDDYSNTYSLEKNINYINKNKSDNITYYLFNHICIKQTIKPIIEYFLNKCIQYEISNIMICNYIKFINPKGTEIKNENDIPVEIINILKKNIYNKYSNCFYDWISYNKYNCNYLCNYYYLDNKIIDYKICKIIKYFLITNYLNKKLYNKYLCILFDITNISNNTKIINSEYEIYF